MAEYLKGEYLLLMPVLLCAGAWFAAQLLSARAQLKALGQERSAPVERLEGKVAAHEARLEALELRSRNQSEELKLLLRGQMAMLRHMLDGSDGTRLRLCCEAIETFLTDR